MSRFEPLRTVDWEEAIALADPALDKFAWTFRAKARAMDLWRHGLCVKNVEDEIMAAIIVRVNRRAPVANLQLLHTFARFRRRGLARELVEREFARVGGEATHFRVSAEMDAIPFYRSLGFKFWGTQKSGSQLSIFRITDGDIKSGIYSLEDPVISKAINRRGRGGLVHKFLGGAT